MNPAQAANTPQEDFVAPVEPKPLTPYDITWQINSSDDPRKNYLIAAMNVLKVLGLYDKKDKKQAIQYFEKNEERIDAVSLEHIQQLLNRPKFGLHQKLTTSFDELLEQISDGACAVIETTPQHFALMPPGMNIRVTDDDILQIRVIDSQQGEIFLPATTLVNLAHTNSLSALLISTKPMNEELRTENLEPEIITEEPQAIEPNEITVQENTKLIELPTTHLASVEEQTVVHEQKEQPHIIETTSQTIIQPDVTPAQEQPISMTPLSSLVSLERKQQTVIINDFDNKKDQLFLAMYEGHGGRKAVEVAAQNLHHNFLTQLHAGIDTQEALSLAFLQTEEHIKEKEIDDGTTAAAIFTDGKRLISANIGDIQVVMLTKTGKAILLSTLHTPSNKEEAQRVKLTGGSIIEDRVAKVNATSVSTLSLTRALGDTSFKPFVIAEPHITEIPITDDAVTILIANKSLWQILTPQKIARLLVGITNMDWATAAIKQEIIKKDPQAPICLLALHIPTFFG